VNPLVDEVIDEIKGLSIDLEFDDELSFREVSEEGYIISSSTTGRVVAVGVMNILDDDNEKLKIVGAFAINVHKYAWAEAEGFTHQQMIDDLNDEIFKLLGVDEVIDYLCDIDFEA
tara:strand:- start:237 stop:584 length:348 start_codon:yes stop_codon:yes gene_type:complete